jgi:hypothetical protein
LLPNSLFNDSCRFQKLVYCGAYSSMLKIKLHAFQ